MIMIYIFQLITNDFFLNLYVYIIVIQSAIRLYFIIKFKNKFSFFYSVLYKIRPEYVILYVIVRNVLL